VPATAADDDDETVAAADDNVAAASAVVDCTLRFLDTCKCYQIMLNCNKCYTTILHFPPRSSNNSTDLHSASQKS